MKYVAACVLFAAGYLLTLETPVLAQAPIQLFDSQGNVTLVYPPAPGPGGIIQWFGPNGTSGQVYTPTPGPGGVGQWFNNDGTSGQIYMPPAPLLSPATPMLPMPSPLPPMPSIAPLPGWGSPY